MLAQNDDCYMHFEADGQACNDGTDWTGGDDLPHGGRYTTVRAIFPCSVAAPSGSVLVGTHCAAR